MEEEELPLRWEPTRWVSRGRNAVLWVAGPLRERNESCGPHLCRAQGSREPTPWQHTQQSWFCYGRPGQKIGSCCARGTEGVPRGGNTKKLCQFHTR